MDVLVLPDHESASLRAAELFAEAARTAVAERGRFAVALSGGSTPQRLYELLAADPRRFPVPWQSTHVVWADERCVSPDHPDSNYRMAHERLLSRVSMACGQIHRIRGEDDPRAAAETYHRVLVSVLGQEGRLDLALLGMGADGHTASLFPNTDALKERERWVVANYVPQLAKWRITLTFPLLNRSREVLFLVTGQEKAEAVRRALTARPGSAEWVPAAGIRPAEGRLCWLLDRAAATGLPRSMLHSRTTG